MSTSTVEWGGLTLWGDRGPGRRFTFDSIEGWEGLPDTRVGMVDRPAAHGSFDDPVWASARTVRVSGRCSSKAERDALLVELGSALALPPQSGPGLADLRVMLAGRTLTASARLTRYRPTLDAWGAGSFGWAAEWHCPDPLRYGPLVSVSTGFPELVGGLAYPLYTDGAGTTLGWLDYGPPSTSGTVALSNPGTADAHPQFEVTGPAPGFEVVQVGTGNRLVYDGTIPSGSHLVVDTASGVAVMDGVSDRTLTWQDPMTVGPGGSAEFAFVPRGESTAAVLRASLRPAYW